MLIRQEKRISFISCVKGNFLNESGENIEYYTLHFFPLDENGNISDIPENVGVKKDVAPLFQNVRRGAVLTVTLEGFVKKAHVINFITTEYEVE